MTFHQAIQQAAPHGQWGWVPVSLTLLARSGVARHFSGALHFVAARLPGPERPMKPAFLGVGEHLGPLLQRYSSGPAASELRLQLRDAPDGAGETPVFADLEFLPSGEKVSLTMILHDGFLYACTAMPGEGEGLQLVPGSAFYSKPTQ
jgi:hypothetical protein